MANIATTEIDYSGIAIEKEEFLDGVLTLAGADVIAAGTILARSTATDKFVLYVQTDEPTAGNNVPAAVLTYAVEKTTAGSGDIPVRPLVRGHVNRGKLIIDADGDGDNVDDAVVQLLENVGIHPEVVQQLGA